MIVGNKTLEMIFRHGNETDIISDVRLLGLAEERDAGVGLRRKNVDERVGVAVECDGGGGLEKLAVDGTEDPDVVVGSGGGSDDAVVLVNHLHELANDERHRLYPLHLLLRSEQLALEILLLILHVLLLDVDELQLALEGFQAAVEVVLVGGRGVAAAEAALEVVGFCRREERRWLRRRFRVQHHRGGAHGVRGNWGKC